MEGCRYGEKIFEVEWGYSGWIFRRVGHAINWEDCEVIGNIHDNPKLLESEESK